MITKLSDNDVENIKKLRADGHSLGQIALKYGVSRQCIQQRLTYRKNRDNKRMSYKEQCLKLQDIIKNKEQKINQLEAELKLVKKTRGA